MTTKQQVRILRVIEYVGDLEWVQACITKRTLKGTLVTTYGTIREAILGDTMELLEAVVDEGKKEGK